MPILSSHAAELSEQEFHVQVIHHLHDSEHLSPSALSFLLSKLKSQLLKLQGCVIFRTSDPYNPIPFTKRSLTTLITSVQC